MGDRPVPGLLVRLVQLPFLPAAWRSSADLGLPLIIGPLILLIVLADTLVGVYRAGEARDLIYEWAAKYEVQADPLVLERGEFHLNGTRPFFLEENGTTVLLDPEFTIPDERITTERYVLVRRDRLEVKQPAQTRAHPRR
jgi:hypothetical protein